MLGVTSVRRYSSLSKIAVVGAGQMGTGIAIIAARQHSIEKVTLFDTNDKQLQQATEYVGVWTKKQVKKGTLTEHVTKALEKKIQYRLWGTVCNEDVDFVIEAVKEVCI
eukprot:Platyproteum_vivax@DN5888_c0_g1_i1.p1